MFFVWFEPTLRFGHCGFGNVGGGTLMKGSGWASVNGWSTGVAAPVRLAGMPPTAAIGLELTVGRSRGRPPQTAKSNW